MNIFGSKSGHLNNSKVANVSSFPAHFCYMQYLIILRVLQHISRTLHFEKSSNTEKKFEKNLPVNNITKNGRFWNQKCSVKISKSEKSTIWRSWNCLPYMLKIKCFRNIFLEQPQMYMKNFFKNLNAPVKKIGYLLFQ